jgi:hypothetical protein
LILCLKSNHHDVIFVCLMLHIFSGMSAGLPSSLHRSSD